MLLLFHFAASQHSYVAARTIDANTNTNKTTPATATAATTAGTAHVEWYGVFTSATAAMEERGDADLHTSDTRQGERRGQAGDLQPLMTASPPPERGTYLQ